MTRPRSALQTFHALQASDLAAAFGDGLQKVRIHPGGYRVELTAPEGPSTAGGVQAMQHVRLVPSEADFPTLVVGHANHAEGVAELRTFEHVDALYRQRFHRSLTLNRTEYEQFLVLAGQVLSLLHLKVTVVGPPAESMVEEPRSGARRLGLGRSALIGLAIGALLLGGLGFWLFR